MLVGKSARITGFTYLGLLFAIAVMSVGLLAISDLWVTTAQRQRETQLLWVGEQFRQAIGSYYQSSPGNQKKYPPNLQELLQDTRYLTIKRHLRQIYLDPMTGTNEWMLIRAPDGGVMGVASLSSDQSVRQEYINLSNSNKILKKTYSEWHFSYYPPKDTIN